LIEFGGSYDAVRVQEFHEDCVSANCPTRSGEPIYVGSQPFCDGSLFRPNSHDPRHVARHRITTNTAIQRLCLPQLGLNAVTKVTARLCRAGLLAKYPLIHPRSTSRSAPSASRFGYLVKSDFAPWSAGSPTEYATLAYVVLGTV